MGPPATSYIEAPEGRAESPERAQQPERELRRYWDDDAATYDRWAEHGAWSHAERAAWAGVLRRLLPAHGLRVLDVGAGTGFLSLAAARLGYQVTALDISGKMLERLDESAARERLDIKIVRGEADDPPLENFDAVMERLALWTLPDPVHALGTWREAAPDGHLIAFEGMWSGRDYSEGLRRRARALLRRSRRLEPEHHAPYSPELKAAIQLGNEISPSAVVEAMVDAGWAYPHLHRLRDVEWARELALPPLDRLLGVTPEYVIVSGRRSPGDQV